MPVAYVDMCGIVGYVGGQDATEVIVEGLRRLEYRGYDSAGVAVIASDGVQSRKRAGKLANLEKALAESPLPETTVGIGHPLGHARAPNDVNAHPHLSGTAGWRSSTTASSRTSRSCAINSALAVSGSSARRTPRWPRICWPWNCATALT